MSSSNPSTKVSQVLRTSETRAAPQKPRYALRFNAKHNDCVAVSVTSAFVMDEPFVTAHTREQQASDRQPGLVNNVCDLVFLAGIRHLKLA